MQKYTNTLATTTRRDAQKGHFFLYECVCVGNFINIYMLYKYIAMFEDVFVYEIQCRRPSTYGKGRGKGNVTKQSGGSGESGTHDG